MGGAGTQTAALGSAGLHFWRMEEKATATEEYLGWNMVGLKVDLNTGQVKCNYLVLVYKQLL